MDINEMLEFDRKHIWHPYTSMTNPLPVYPVKEARGCKLVLYDGRELIDGMASWWAVIHGYNNPILNEAIVDQLNKMAHVMFGGITHEPAVLLAKKLIEITPSGLDKVFFCCSGSVSVEVAIKMAFQYWISKGKKEKSKLLTVLKGYHGDTFGAMAVCDPINGMHEVFTHVLPKHFFAPEPKISFYDEWNKEDISKLKHILEEHNNEIAAVILEPICQGAGGMRFYHPQYLKELRSLCDEYNILLIFDEIATGFGRTGELFASFHAGITPDIMCVGKALTGGYMSFGATLCTEEVAITISEGPTGVFMHGPTFMGNPLACAVSLKSIELLLSMDWKKKIKRMESIFLSERDMFLKLKGVKDVRALGSIFVVETERSVNVPKAQRFFVKKGVWIRPFLNLIYIMPPYVIDDVEIKRLLDAIFEVLKKDEY